MGKMKAFYHEELSEMTEREMGSPDMGCPLPQVFILWCSEYPDTERHMMGVYADEASAHFARLLFIHGDTSAAYDGRFKYEVQAYDLQGAA
jgi:hypothetical protein